MKYLYCVFDSLNSECAQPFMMNNDDVAIDMFIKDIKQIAKQNLAKFEAPDIARYKLIRLCSFNPDDGELSSYNYSIHKDDDCVVFGNNLIYDVEKDFDMSIYDEQIKENFETKGMEVNNG